MTMGNDDDETGHEPLVRVKAEVEEATSSGEDGYEDQFLAGSNAQEGGTTRAGKVQRREATEETGMQTKNSRWSLRRTQARLKMDTKVEPASEEDNDNDDDNADQDYNLDEDDEHKEVKKRRVKRKTGESTGKGAAKSSAFRTCKRKRVSEMSEEERDKIRERWRAEARAKRARKSDGKKVDDEDADGDDNKNKSGGRSGSAGRRKRRVDEMTEEEREAMKEKWREQGRRKRERKALTPQQREQENEKRRVRRALARATKTEEEREEENRKARERKKARRARMTPEEKKEESQKLAIWRMGRLATMSEDEKKMRKMNEYLRAMARKASLPPEELERRRLRHLEYIRRRKEQLSAEELEQVRLKRNSYRKNMTPEKKARYLERLKENHKRNYAKLKENPEKWEKMRERWREDFRRRQKKMIEMGRNYVRKVRKDVSKTKGAGEKKQSKRTPEQLEMVRRKRRATRRKCGLKARIRRNLTIQKLLDSGMSHEEIQQQIETPERRQRRLIQVRIGKAKLNLRKRLQGMGAPAEEIEKRLDELQQTYQPIYQFRPFKPRPEAWKPIQQSDLALLEESRRNRASTTVATCSTSAYSSTTLPIPLRKEPQQPTTSVSRTPTAAGKRGRPSKKWEQQHTQAPAAQQSSNRGALMGYPFAVATAASSYISSTTTHEPARYTAQQQQHQQFKQPEHHHLHSNQYHQQYQSAALAYSHQQRPSHQQQPYSLQHVLENLTYQDSGSYGPPVVESAALDNQVNYQHHGAHQHQLDNNSSHVDYASSYDNHSPEPASPPVSPPGEDDDDDDYAYSTPSFHQALNSKRSRAGRPRKEQCSRPKQPTGSRGGPKGLKPATVCDECGNAYANLRQHQTYYHNPNYKDKKCQVCGVEFKLPQHWYTHYLRAHQNKAPKAAPDSKTKPHMCDICGTSFRQKGNLHKHKYYVHGDGLKKENWKQCPVCPGERLFKEAITMYDHLRKWHPDYKRAARDCYRCDRAFPNDKELNAHVQQEHPDSHFPCQYCNVCKFSKVALNFHYRRCVKVSREQKEVIMKDKELFSWDREPVPCEICGRSLTIGALSRHYLDMHNVKEDNFSCPHCGKGFKKRDFWAVHMQEKHLKTLDEMREMVSCLNVASREGLVIVNPSGKRPAVRKKKSRKTGALKKRKAVSDDVASDSLGQEQFLKGGRKRKGKRRRVLVIAEEDEQLDLVASGEDTERSSEGTRTQGSKPIPKGKGAEIKKEFEENSDDEEEGNR